MNNLFLQLFGDLGPHVQFHNPGAEAGEADEKNMLLIVASKYVLPATSKGLIHTWLVPKLGGNGIISSCKKICLQ